jgi:hypothetical protein
MMTRLKKLKDLERLLKQALDDSNPNSMPSLAKQYRETIREIEELEGTDEKDEISSILFGDGEPGTDS